LLSRERVFRAGVDFPCSINIKGQHPHSEPGPLGETFFEASALAMTVGFLLNNPESG
jgi:hypothetical protein